MILQGPLIRPIVPEAHFRRDGAPSSQGLRPHIVALAREWLGTPYHHQASVRGIGTDCVGLVRGIWRELYGANADGTLPAYTRDWAEGSGRETLLEAARRHLIDVPRFEAQPGDVLVFRWRRNTLAKHCAILSKPTAMIHALEGAPVTEVAFSPWWRRHLAAAFAFPAASDPPGLTPRAALDITLPCAGLSPSHLRGEGEGQPGAASSQGVPSRCEQGATVIKLREL